MPTKSKHYFDASPYISTCRKHGLSAVAALGMLYAGQLPEFITLDAVPSDFQMTLPNELPPKKKKGAGEQPPEDEQAPEAE